MSTKVSESDLSHSSHSSHSSTLTFLHVFQVCLSRAVRPACAACATVCPDRHIIAFPSKAPVCVCARARVCVRVCVRSCVLALEFVMCAYASQATESVLFIGT